MKKMLSKSLMFCLGFLLVSSVVAAEENVAYKTIPTTINVQGRLTESYGDPYRNKDIKLYLDLYNGSSWENSIKQDAKTDSEGVYNANIDISDKITTNPTKFKLGIGSSASGDGYDFSAVPYSIFASTSNYTLELSTFGKKLVDENFIATSTYTIKVATASYAEKADKISTPGNTGSVWGINPSGKQEWMDPGSLSIPVASTSTLGGIKLGNNTGLASELNGGVLELKKATASTIGGVIVGSNIDVLDGVISVSASTVDKLGVVKVTNGNGLSISDGVISMSLATSSTLGTMKLYTSTGTSTNGTMTQNAITTAIAGAATNIPVASETSTGTVKIGSNINVDNNGVISVSTPTSDKFGVVKVDSGNGLSISDGVISMNVAGTSQYGTVKLDDSLMEESANAVKASAVYGAISSTYTALVNNLGNKVDKTRTIAELSLENDITANDLRTKLNVEAGAAVNKIESVKVNGTALTITDKAVDIILGSGSFTAVSPLSLDSSNKLSLDIDSSLDISNDKLTVKKINSDSNISTKTSGTIKVWAKDGDSQGWYTVQISRRGTGTQYYNLENADLAEIYKSPEKLVPGDVVSIDTANDNSIVKTKVAEDTLVAGVISTEPAIVMNQKEKGYKLAFVGKVPTKVCNEGGNIKRGDLLVSASIAGYAKKAGDNPKVGTVIGKALENFDSQKGTILVLVNLQ